MDFTVSLVRKTVINVYEKNCHIYLNNNDKIKYTQLQCNYNNNLIREIYDTSNFKHLHRPAYHICNYVAWKACN